MSVKGPIHDSDLQSQPRCAARSRLRLLLMVYPHTQRPICSIFLSWIAVLNSVGPRLWWPGNIALFLEAQLTRSGRFCPYTTATSTATLSSAHQISENSDQQQPQQRSASHGGGCGCRSPYTGNLVEVAVGNRGCDWRSLSWMGPFK